ncbi:MAG TPA: tyrosine-type recombinase/integrase, partial [Sphingomicrobium sp.]|nr:tyrosine-type recombinase/integrase [Sphingomicrobium sp.]
ATERLRERLARLPRTQLPLVVSETTGRVYGESDFSHKFREIARSAGLDHLIFRQLRHTCVVNMARAGCSNAEIANVTGHSMQTVHQILKRYLVRDSEIARNAIAKVEEWRRKRNAAETKV